MVELQNPPDVRPRVTVAPAPMSDAMFPYASSTLTVAVNVRPRFELLHVHENWQPDERLPVLTLGGPVQASLAPARNAPPR